MIFNTPVFTKGERPEGGQGNAAFWLPLLALFTGARHHYFSVESGFSGPSPHHHHVMTTVSGSWWSGPYDHRGIAVADSR